MLSLERLKTTKEWKALSSKGNLFVETYIQSFLDLGEPDVIFATLSAYETTPGESARLLGYSILRQKKIQAALRVWNNYGKSKKQIAIEQIEAEISTTRPGSIPRRKLLAAKASLLVKKKRKNTDA